MNSLEYLVMGFVVMLSTLVITGVLLSYTSLTLTFNSLILMLTLEGMWVGTLLSMVAFREMELI